MHFNISELYSRLEKLESLINSSSSKIKRLEILRDIKLIKMILNYVDSTNYDISDINNLFVSAMDERNKVLIDFFSRYYKTLYNFLSIYSFDARLPWRIHISKRISTHEYEKILIDFFKSFDPRLLDLFIELKESNRIELNPKKYIVSKGAIGVNIHLITSDESYILSRFNNKVNTASIVPHEVGHAFTCRNTTDSYSFISKNSSLFSEAYSIFLEMVFFDYLKNTKYYKDGINSLYNKLDSFLAVCECFNSNILLFNDLYTKNGKIYLCDGTHADTYASKLVFSNLLAMYLLDLYRNDRKKFFIEVNTFIDMFGHASDEEILVKFNLENLVNSTNNVLDSYIKTYRK